MTSQTEESITNCSFQSTVIDEAVENYSDPTVKPRTNVYGESNIRVSTHEPESPVIKWCMSNLIDPALETNCSHYACSPLHGEAQQKQQEQTSQQQHPSRRKRRKQLAPPHKFSKPSSQPDENIHFAHDSESEGESLRSSSDEDTSEKPRHPFSTQTELHKWKARKVDVPNILGTQYGSLIDEISERAMSALRHSVSPSNSSLNTDERMDQFVELALQHLEPHIARLVGQSIRTSIQTIREQMIAGLKANKSNNEQSQVEVSCNLISTGKNIKSANPSPIFGCRDVTNQTKDVSGFTIGELSGDMSSESCNKLEEVKGDITLNTTDKTKQSTHEPLCPIKQDGNQSVLSATLLEMNRTMIPNGTFRTLVPPLPMMTAWNMDMGHPSSLIPLDGGTKLTSHTRVLEHQQTKPNFSDRIIDVIGTANSVSPLKLALDVDSRLSNGNLQGVQTIDGSVNHTEINASNQTETPDIEIMLTNNTDQFGTAPTTINSATVQSSGSNLHQNDFSKPAIPQLNLGQCGGAASATAAAALMTALGLANNSIWNNRRATDHLMPWIPTYNPGLFDWIHNTQSNESNKPMGLQTVSSLNPFELFPTISARAPSTAPINGIHQMGLLKSHTVCNTEEQTEALSLVIRSSNKDPEARSFGSHQIQRDSTSEFTDGQADSTTIYSSYAPHNYPSSMFSRRKRTKVTDTRMSSRGSRAQAGFIPRTNAHLFDVANCAATFRMFNGTTDGKQSPSKTSIMLSGSLPVTTTQSTGRTLKSNELDRHSTMCSSPTNLNEARLNSSSSSPSPNSIRFSGGSRDLADLGPVRPNFDRLNPAGFYHSQLQNMRTDIKQGIGSISSHTSKDPRISEADAFEKIFTKTFHPYVVSKRTIDGAGKALPLSSTFNTSITNSSNINRITESNSEMFDSNYLNSRGCQLSQRENRPFGLGRNGGSLDHPGLRSSLPSFTKHGSGESLLKRGLSSSLVLSGSCHDSDVIGDAQSGNGTVCADGVRITSTLTPVHLRKAKLMFFYTRYPNSTLIKMYFPDVKFYKNNTAQLVKWFSNFREFYYIQMEKFARVAISEGVRSADDIHVTTDSELYRALNLHYNRNQQLEVPEHFRIVVEATLREFFNALVSGKDSEQSWKKPIYKIIARMDQPVPEFFKNPNWMEQLADG